MDAVQTRSRLAGWSGRRRAHSPVAARPSERPREIACPLLPLMFRPLERPGPLTVLDVAAGSAGRVRFLGRLQCRVFYADLYDDLGNGEPGIGPAGEFFERIGSVRFDVCLFWDFLNYLSAADLREFGRLLRGHLHPHTHAHAFGVFTTVSHLNGLRFDLHDEGRLRVVEDCGPTPFRHTNKSMGRVLWPLSVSRATLLEDNRQEMLLTADPAATGSGR